MRSLLRYNLKLLFSPLKWMSCFLFTMLIVISMYAPTYYDFTNICEIYLPFIGVILITDVMLINQHNNMAEILYVLNSNQKKDFLFRYFIIVILIVIFGGALGGSIHALASMSHHTKKGTLDRKYVLWYISRPFIGAAIALTVHFAIRGGILTASSDIGFLNPYGVAALSIIVGLMTEQVTEKLKTVFNALFGLDGKSHVQSS